MFLVLGMVEDPEHQARGLRVGPWALSLQHAVIALIVAVEVALATGLVTAVRCAVILLAALPLTALALRLAALTWRSPLAALWFGAITTHLALALEARHPAIEQVTFIPDRYLR